MAETTTNKDRLKDITDSIEAGIKDLFQSDKYAQYLQTMSRFHRYSVNNTMLIYLQKPDATLVAGFNKWRDQFERNVMKGEKGIKIIAPTPFKKKIEQEKLDPDTKQPVYDADGNAVMEEKEIKIPMYKPVTVFDVSQTDGKPLPELAANLTGSVQNYDVFMEALKCSAPVPLAFEKMAANMDGYFSPDEQRIAIREGMSEVQTVSAAVHEIAHSKLHNQPKTENVDAPKRKGRNTEEVEAESVSCAVCAYYGIATGENSFGYIATWSKDKELPELRASLETINKTSSELISDVDRNYAIIMKERGIEKVQESDEPRVGSEKTVETKIEAYDPNAPLPPFPEDYPMPDPAVTIADRDAYGYTENDMLPLSPDKAAEFLDKDVTVYMLHPGNGASMVFEREDIAGHDGMFSISREDWEDCREYLELAAGHELSDQELEKTFLCNPADAFAIYQLKHDDTTRDIRFEPLERITAVGLTVERENYECVYTDGFDGYSSRRDRLEDLWDTFNNHIPEDFHHHSMSVSDIIAIKQSGKVSYHYVDSFDFAELPSFQKPENYLKNAEMAMEDDYGMIDGVINNGPKQPTVAELEQRVKSGQQISLMDLAGAVHRERAEKKPSVLEQLKNHEAKETTNKTAQKRSAEREL
ncbi:MAG: YodL domain-containing protein [Oscillospiraceae bacterium]|nr:YodL domain-containing protein [Oscillospiraceae bacterium]